MPDGTSLLIPFIPAPHSSEFSTTFEFCLMVICFLQTKQSRLEGIFVVMLLLLLLSHFSRVQLCATPQTAAHQAPLSLGGKNTGVGCHFPLHCSDEIIHRQHSLSEMCLDSLSQWCLQHHSSLLLLRCFSLSGPHTGAHVIICFRSLIPSIFCSFSRTDSREGVRKKKNLNLIW